MGQNQSFQESKIFLCGGSESGKSMLVKQINIYTNSGYSQKILDIYKGVIYGTILKTTGKILTECKRREKDLPEDVLVRNLF